MRLPRIYANVCWDEAIIERIPHFRAAIRSGAMNDTFGKNNKLAGFHFRVDHFCRIVIEFQLKVHFIETVRTAELNRSDSLMGAGNKLETSIFKLRRRQCYPNG